MIGGFITATGIHNPFLIFGPAIAAIGSGLLMLLDEHSYAGRWIGFQILLGIGVGFCLTIPLMLSQVVVKTKDVSTATPIIICGSRTNRMAFCALTVSLVCQSMGSAFLLPIAQAVFQNVLVQSLKELVPDVEPLAVLSAGANKEAISSFPKASLAGIITSYDRALSRTFSIGIPFAGAALLVSLFMPWFRYHDATKKEASELESNKSVNDKAVEGDCVGGGKKSKE